MSVVSGKSPEGFPIINGVTVLYPPPDPTYVVDFDNPQRQYVLEHYLIFGILGPLAFIALCQRFYVKVFLSKGLQLDDAFMALAWASSVVVQGMLVHTVIVKGFGIHTWEMPLQTYKDTLFVSYITAGLFMLCNGFTKLSLLTFYLGLSPQQWWRIAVWTSLVFVGLYTVIITFMLFVHCNPPRKAFDIMAQGSCINVGILFIATAAFNIATDVLLFILPIPMIVRLRMGVFQKVGAIVVFAIGSVTVMTSIIRLVFLFTVLRSRDIAWDAARANIWSFLEANLFIICGSMPTIRKFFKHFAPKLMGASTSAPSYGTPGYAGGYAGKQTNAATGPRSRKLRSQYENFDDDENEMQIFDSTNSLRDRDRDVKHGNVNAVVVDGGGEPQPDNGSEKAILQTKTFDVRYD